MKIQIFAFIDDVVYLFMIPKMPIPNIILLRIQQQINVTVRIDDGNNSNLISNYPSVFPKWQNLIYLSSNWCWLLCEKIAFECQAWITLSREQQFNCLQTFVGLTIYQILRYYNTQMSNFTFLKDLENDDW